jgi:glycosyltransferase involved in cell wall biosynthesis
MKEWTIAAVIVTWNRKEDLLKAIESLKAQTYPFKQIIVADNGSTDGTVDAVRERYPDVLVLPLGDNYGACHGRNMGTREVRCDLAYYLDDDITLAPDCIEEIIHVFQNHPEVGAVQTTIIGPWADPNPPLPRTLKNCPHPIECSFAFRMELMPADPWPAHFNRQGEGPWLAMHVYDRGCLSVFWAPGKTFHHCSPGGLREKVLFFYSRNSFLTHFQRMPLPLMPPMATYKALRPLLNVRSWHDFRNWVKAISDGLRLILTGKARRQPISWQAARTYLRAVKRNHQPLE